MRTTDPGFLHGIGVFETLDGRPGSLSLRFLDRHVARLRAGAELLGIRCPPLVDLRPALDDQLARNPGDDVIRITLTPGADHRGRIVLTTRRRQHCEPVSLVVSPFRRSHSDPTTRIKTTSYAFHAMAKARAKAEGADDAILLDEAGTLAETTTCNLFFVAGDTLCTPSLDGPLLPGIIRALLIEVARAAGWRVLEARFRCSDLRAADAVFVTNAVHGPRLAILQRQHADRPIPAHQDMRRIWSAHSWGGG